LKLKNKKQRREGFEEDDYFHVKKVRQNPLGCVLK